MFREEPDLTAVQGRFYEAFCLPDYTYVNQMAERDPKRHIQRQKNLAAGYALSSIIKSEAQVDSLVGLLEHRLDTYTKTGEPVHFDKWFNFFAFDVGALVTTTF